MKKKKLGVAALALFLGASMVASSTDAHATIQAGGLRAAAIDAGLLRDVDASSRLPRGYVLAQYDSGGGGGGGGGGGAMAAATTAAATTAADARAAAPP